MRNAGWVLPTLPLNLHSLFLLAMAHYHFASTNALEQLEYVIDDLPLSCWELGFCQRHSPKFYVERCGCSIGIFMSWLECMKQVQGFWRAEFKKFRIWNKANEYLQLKRQV
uniref:Ribonuclease H1 N-terminal domain-containing protein n=1 Tax=Physcomitrium patens TaxID=3218 RepID=A0A2K1JIW6_PHYPA|nr:hypothetical protein PHYPA_018894 [Physcomitrium patens]